MHVLGIWGVIATGGFRLIGVLTTPIYVYASAGEWINQILVQAIGAGSLVFWTGELGLVMLNALKKLKTFCVIRDEELC